VKISDLVFMQQVIAAVATVVNLYSDLVSFNEDVKVRRQALSLAEKLYNDNRSRWKSAHWRQSKSFGRCRGGAVATGTDAGGNAGLQQETILKNYLSRNGLASPSLQTLALCPRHLRSRMSKPFEPVQDLVPRHREPPELQQTALQIENARISFARQQEPVATLLNLVASHRTRLGWDSERALFPAGPNACPLESTRALAEVWQRLDADPFAQLPRLSRRLPVEHAASQPRRASRRDARSVTLRQSELRQRQELNQIRVDVQKRVIGLQQSRRRYQAAQKSAVCQEQTLDAETEEVCARALTDLLRHSGASGILRKRRPCEVARAQHI
jgi:hypothetical protein